MGSADLMRHLHECLTGLGDAIGVPGHGAYLDHALADQPFVGGFEPRVGGKHVRVVAVQGYPNATTPGLADPLLRLPFPYRWSVRFVPLSPATAAKVIGKSQLGWFQKRRGAGDWAKDMASKQKRQETDLDLAFQDGNATAMVHDAGAARATNSGGEVRFGFLTCCAVVMADDARTADDRAGAVLKSVRDLGFTGRVEDVNAVEAFLGSLPGHGRPNLRRPVLSTENVVDVLPLTSPWGGPEAVPSGLFPEGSPPLLWAQTDGSTPFRLCLHEGDVGHTLVVGATGAGKSVLVGLLVAQWRRYARARTVVFDVGYSHYVSGRAMGAAHYDLAGPLGGGEAVEMQPLRDVDRADVRTWAVDWIEALVELQGEALSPSERGRVAHAVTLLAQNLPRGRTLTALLVNLGTERLRALVRPYTLEGAYGHLFDADHDSFGSGGKGEGASAGSGQHQVVELSHLVGMSDTRARAGPHLPLPPRRGVARRRADAHRDRGGVGGAHARPLLGSPPAVAADAAQAQRGRDRGRPQPGAVQGPGCQGRAAAHRELPDAHLPAQPRRLGAGHGGALRVARVELGRGRAPRPAPARSGTTTSARRPGARMFDLALSPVELRFPHRAARPLGRRDGPRGGPARRLRRSDVARRLAPSRRAPRRGAGNGAGH